jgi:hypothetical protein
MVLPPPLQSSLPGGSLLRGLLAGRAGVGALFAEALGRAGPVAGRLDADTFPAQHGDRRGSLLASALSGKGASAGAAMAASPRPPALH